MGQILFTLIFLLTSEGPCDVWVYPLCPCIVIFINILSYFVGLFLLFFGENIL